MKYIKPLLIILFMFPVFAGKAQQAIPDAAYRKAQHAADSLWTLVNEATDSTDKVAKAKEAAKIYDRMAKTYRMQTTDYYGYMQMSLAAKNADAFCNAIKLYILNSEESIASLLKSYYGTPEEAIVLKNEPFLSAIKRLHQEEPNLIRHARLHINWLWVITLEAMLKSDQEFRILIHDRFKDSVTAVEAMVALDSAHLVEFCEAIKDNGFPNMSTVGVNAGLAQILLKHFSGLFWAEPRGDFYIAKWRFLVPYLSKAALQGEMEYGFYNRIIDRITDEAKQSNRMADAEYFHKFKYD